MCAKRWESCRPPREGADQRSTCRGYRGRRPIWHARPSRHVHPMSARALGARLWRCWAAKLADQDIMTMSSGQARPCSARALVHTIRACCCLTSRARAWTRRHVLCAPDARPCKRRGKGIVLITHIRTIIIPRSNVWSWSKREVVLTGRKRGDADRPDDEPAV